MICYSTFDEDVDSETLNQYLHSTSDLQLVELPDSEIPFGDETMDVQNKFTIFECHTDPYQKPVTFLFDLPLKLLSDFVGINVKFE